LAQPGQDIQAEELARETAVGVARRHLAEGADGALRQIVEHQVIDAGGEKLRHRHDAVGAEGRGPADADDLIGHQKPASSGVAFASQTREIALVSTSRTLRTPSTSRASSGVRWNTSS